MKRLLLFLALALAFGGAAGGCNEGVDTTPPPADDDDDDDGAGDDDDDGGVQTPTPTPAPTALEGDPWTTTATPPSAVCAFFLEFPYGNAGTAPIGVTRSNGELTFDVGLHLDPNIGIGEEPSGTVASDGAFTQTLSYCSYNGASTMKYDQSWVGTFASDDLSFDATMSLVVTVLNGDHRSVCATATFDPFGDCTDPGMSYAIHGEKN